MHEDDLYVCQFGVQDCEPGHSFGPAVRDHFLIHFVASGCGTLYTNGWAYPVQAGQGFLILPDEETFYQASDTMPWHYAWVGFRGRLASQLAQMAGLDSFHRVFSCSDPEAAWKALEMMRDDAQQLRLGQLAAIGDLLRFLSLVAPAHDPNSPTLPSHQYCEKAIWFMEGRFDRDVSIQETADFVGLSRSHLYRVMMAEYGCAPKEMLMRIRMRRAEQLLRETSLTLDDIALRVGLRTGAQLGAAFRAAYGTSPGQYRKEKPSPP